MMLWFYFDLAPIGNIEFGHPVNDLGPLITSKTEKIKWSIFYFIAEP